MSNRQVIYTVTLNNAQALRGMVDLENQANRIDSVMGALKGTVEAVGIAWGAIRIAEIGKEWIQGAADYETAMLRIRNASGNALEGQKNIEFINSEVDKLKLTLQDATDGYGKFLVRIANSGLAGDQVRKLHDEILSISKVMGVNPSTMDAAVLDIGKMLAEGVLEARTMRQLERIFPQITPFIAQQLGISLQQLSQAESKGTLTKSAIDSRVLLTAIDKYYDSIKNKIPESLTTMQSGINEVDTAWVRFKNDLVYDNRKEIVQLFDDLKSGIAWLRDHKDDIEKWGAVLIKVGAGWLAIRGAIWLTKTAVDSIRGISSLFLGETVAQTTAYEAQAVAINAVAAAIERLNFVQNAQNGSFITNAAGVTMANTVGNRYAMASEAAAEGGAGAAAGAGLASGIGTFVGGALLVTLTAASIYELVAGIKGADSKGNPWYLKQLTMSDWQAKMYGSKRLIEDNGSTLEDLYRTEDAEFKKRLADLGYKDITDANIAKINASYKAAGEKKTPFEMFQELYGSSTYAPSMADVTRDIILRHNNLFNNDQSSTVGGVSPKIPKIAGTQHIRGNSVTNIHVEIHKQIGIEKQEIKNIKDFDSSQFKSMVIRTLTDAVNDAQVVAKHG